MKTYLVHFYYDSAVPLYSHAVEASDEAAAQAMAYAEFSRLGLVSGVTQMTAMEI